MGKCEGNFPLFCVKVVDEIKRLIYDYKAVGYDCDLRGTVGVRLLSVLIHGEALMVKAVVLWCQVSIPGPNSNLISSRWFYYCMGVITADFCYDGIPPPPP